MAQHSPYRAEGHGRSQGAWDEDAAQSHAMEFMDKWFRSSKAEGEVVLGHTTWQSYESWEPQESESWGTPA